MRKMHLVILALLIGSVAITLILCNNQAAPRHGVTPVTPHPVPQSTTASYG